MFHNQLLKDATNPHFQKFIQPNIPLNIYSIIKLPRLNIKTGNSPVLDSSILLDKKYDDIRIEAINAGIILKETNEKIDEIINDGHTIKSYAHDIRSNALQFYQNLIQSKKLIRYCQLVFLLIIITIMSIFIGKLFTRKKNS